VYGFASPTKGRSVNTDQQWSSLAFGDYPQLVRSAVSLVLAEPSSLYHSPIEEVRLDSWHRGRVVLIGDAAHATAPVWAHGAALAAEAALVLAELLATREDWATVGSGFDGRQRPRVEHVQKMTDPAVTNRRPTGLAARRYPACRRAADLPRNLRPVARTRHNQPLPRIKVRWRRLRAEPMP
jgi:2-polyprenyl-6-methoxyphenol hydroxylase-like FAD-dependent oxidoreductase